MTLTAHQKRILAAMLALETQYGQRWWSRDAIGDVVGAGGYHRIIQVRTMHTLRDAKLVIVEAESFPPEVAAVVRCGCACHHWGLTAKGRDTAAASGVRQTDTSKAAMERWKHETRNNLAFGMECVNRGGKTQWQIDFENRDNDDDEPDAADDWKR